GYLFPETYRFADELGEQLNLNLKVYSPLRTAAWQEALYGKLWEQGEGGLEKYGQLNKVEPMNRALRELGSSVWISGLRRAQSESRAHLPFADAQQQTLKVYPILDWSDDEVEAYMAEHELPRNPLIYEGYVSIGDWHSTQPLEEGMKPEETRHDGIKRECGLHLPSNNSDFQI
ncbi:MAG: phosphoadenylyl-sulfate reductase, partial [Verrucomicrobiota bacterium]